LKISRLAGAHLAVVAVLAAAAAGLPHAQSPLGAPYTVLSRDGRRPLPARTLAGQEMFALDELARLFDLTIREDTLAGGLTISTKTQSIVLTPGQGLASVGSRLISLPAPPVREGRTWFVPVDFVPRALGPALDTRIELRKPSRLIVVGDVRVPRVAGRVDGSSATARLTLDVAPATAHVVSQEADRLIVRFEADALDATLPASTAPDLIAGIRPGESASTIAIELGPRFGSYRASQTTGDRGAGRIVIEVAAHTTEAPAPAAPTAPAPAPPPEPPPLLDLVPAGGVRTVVIDPGHGGDEHGARGAAGTLEKDVTLSVGRRLKAALESRLGLRVILTREGDQTVGLDERAALANNNKADLFISLHASASVRPSASGAEVFYLSLEEYGDEAQRVAHGDGEAVPVFGGGSRDIELILWEMAQARYIAGSAALAELVEAELRERVPMSPRAIQQAPFRALVGANMPAVLVEMGFISNPEQEKQLASDAFQNAVVQALVQSIIRYRDGHVPSRPATTDATPADPGDVSPPAASRSQRTP
jgi:N-acetylmuramoyl-L-alanine amidase